MARGVGNPCRKMRSPKSRSSVTSTSSLMSGRDRMSSSCAPGLVSFTHSTLCPTPRKWLTVTGCKFSSASSLKSGGALLGQRLLLGHHFLSEGEGGPDILGRNVIVGLKDVLEAAAIGEIFEDQLHRYARAADHRLAAEYARIGVDMVAPVHL